MCAYYRHQVTMMRLNWGLRFLLLWMNFQHWMWRHWTNSCSSEHRDIGIILWAASHGVLLGPVMRGTSIIQKYTCLHRLFSLGRTREVPVTFLLRWIFRVYTSYLIKNMSAYWWGWSLPENKIWVTRIRSGGLLWCEAMNLAKRTSRFFINVFTLIWVTHSLFFVSALS